MNVPSVGTLDLFTINTGLESGANIVAVKEILGHSSLDRTMRYAHPEKSTIDAVEKLATIKV